MSQRVTHRRETSTSAFGAAEVSSYELLIRDEGPPETCSGGSKKDYDALSLGRRFFLLKGLRAKRTKRVDHKVLQAGPTLSHAFLSCFFYFFYRKIIGDRMFSSLLTFISLSLVFFCDKSNQ